MIPLLVRVIKRLMVLAVGLLVVYMAVYHVFPIFDRRLPLALALFTTYVIMAYAAIPALFRGIRFFWRPSHIPLYSVTPDGFASDPVNIGLVGTRPQVILAMEAAGWQLADHKSLRTMAQALILTFLGQSYPAAPMSSLFLFGRKQDLGFELEIENSRGYRHHVRFWSTDAETPESFTHHTHFWQHLYRPHHRKSDRQLWVGAASKDVGFAPIRHNAQLTHMIDPDTNAERELIVADLEKSKRIVRKHDVIITRPYRLANRAWRGFLLSDGRMTICELV
ncbi:MAG: LssY C-terminal domain-containing protein [Candidatus Saccharimonadales bacterium]